MEDNKKHGCDCGCDHEHDHDCDCDCGCQDEVITLFDEEGNEVNFYIVGILDHEGKEYACLQAADDEEAVVEIFEVVEAEENGEPIDSFLPIDDELYEVLFEKLIAEANAQSCDCGDDCDCNE